MSIDACLELIGTPEALRLRQHVGRSDDPCGCSQRIELCLERSLRQAELLRQLLCDPQAQLTSDLLALEIDSLLAEDLLSTQARKLTTSLSLEACQCLRCSQLAADVLASQFRRSPGESILAGLAEQALSYALATTSKLTSPDRLAGDARK